MPSKRETVAREWERMLGTRTGESDLSQMWYIPMCSGRVCRTLDCQNGHYFGAVPVFHL